MSPCLPGGYHIPSVSAAIKSHICKTNHKYGIKIPTSNKHAHQINERNGNSFWRDTIGKEITNGGIAYEVFGEGEKRPPGRNKVTLHLVFDVKMDFKRNVRWVIDGHKTPDLIGLTYMGVLARDSMQIKFT